MGYHKFIQARDPLLFIKHLYFLNGLFPQSTDAGSNRLRDNNQIKVNYKKTVRLKSYF